MRHDRRPYLVKKLLFTLAEARAKHFLHPQFDELGEGCWSSTQLLRYQRQ